MIQRLKISDKSIKKLQKQAEETAAILKKFDIAIIESSMRIPVKKITNKTRQEVSRDYNLSELKKDYLEAWGLSSIG